MQLTINAHAKINLTLEVLGKRVDGFHELRSLVVPISVVDTIILEEAKEVSSNVGYEDDLCIRAARALDTHRGVKITVTKRIPAGGGLGGGSADAAAVLVGLNELWGLGYSRLELANIGAKIGSDVPAQVMGEPVVMSGRGETVEIIEGMPRLNLVLVNPGVHSSTKDVYAICNPRQNAKMTDRMIAALRGRDFVDICSCLSNDLQVPAVSLHPQIGAAIDMLRQEGLKGVLMSGSGACVFGLTSDQAEAQSVAERLAARGYDAMAVHSECKIW